MMKNKGYEEGLMSRYNIKKVLGNYPPWQGFCVSDSLSDKDYLYFSIMPPSGLTLSLDDLKLRDFLFSQSGTLTPPTLSLQTGENGISFLLPQAELIPLTKALPGMKHSKNLELLKNLASQILEKLSSGLYFYNLTTDSIVIANGSPTILPTAYLLPGEIIEKLHQGGSKYERHREPLFSELRTLAEILITFSQYLAPKDCEVCTAIAEKLDSLDETISGEQLYEILDSLCTFLDTGPPDPMLVTRRELPSHIPHKALESLKRAAAEAQEGTKQIVIVRGTSGEGKTRFLSEIEQRLQHQWGYRRGAIISDQTLFSNHEECASNETHDFVIIDDHIQENLLSCYLLDRLCRELEQCNLAVLAINENPPAYFLETLYEESRKKGIAVKEIELPVPTESQKRRVLAQYLPAMYVQSLSKRIDLKRPLAFLNYAVRRLYAEEGSPKRKTQTPSIGTLRDDVQSVLTFLAIFKFEAPLSFIRNIYTTEENSIYSLLQQLCLLGLVRVRADISCLADGDICLLYSLSCKSLSEMVLKRIPEKRRKQIHRNTALILKGMKSAPLLYIFYHLVGGGEKAEAALEGYKLFHTLLMNKRLSAITCFNESFFSEKLESYLPAETRFRLLIELGNYFSLIGNISKAESIYRRCREQALRDKESQKYRALLVEAVRHECEILEKKGEFLKAERLLERTLDTHGEHLLAHERAKLYNDLAWIHYRLGGFDKSWENCLLVHKLLDDKQHPIEIAQSYNLMGTINWNRSKYDDAILCHKRCLLLREESNDEIGIASSYNNLGLVYKSMGRMKEALECFQKSMEIKHRHNNLPGIAAAHLNIALTYLGMENMKEAEKSCTLACQLAEDIGNQQLLAEGCGTMGEIQYRLGNFDAARNWYLRDLQYCTKTSSDRERACTYRRLGELSLAEEKTAEATDFLSKAKNINRRIGSRLETALLNILEGRIYLAEGKRDLGRHSLEGASLELSILGRKNTAAAIAAEIGELFMAEGNEPLAREYHLRATVLCNKEEEIPENVRRLQEQLDQRSPLALDHINSDAARFKALCRVTALIRTMYDTERLNKAITEIARNITGMDRATLILQTDAKTGVRILAADGDENMGGLLTDKNVIGMIGLARQVGYPIDISRNNIPKGKISARFLKQHPRIICIPLRIQDEVTGFLYLDSATQNARTKDADHSFLLAFSQQVALALERTILSEKIGEIEKSKIHIKPEVAKSKGRVTFHDIIGNSPPIRHIYELIESIKDMETTLLLTGPSGVGKDLIAKTIHYSGNRRDRPFHSLNCSAFPGELLESELFGHERGAFTGAHRQKTGHFESANGGTIFLNEIGDMSLKLQPKLLRVLEEQKFYRVGGTKEISTNVRIIAATNKELLTLVKEGRFREDLYYRINIFPIRIPALRERKEDIPLLCNHFLTTFCRLYNIPVKKISPEAMTYLVEFDWQGNVRELENTINRMIIISKKDVILPEDLPQYIMKRQQSSQEEMQASFEDILESLIDTVEFSSSDPILPKVQGMLIQKIVERVGDKTKAAAFLGISKPTLYSKLKNNG
ncbi:MAG: sigma 54-interacting transcriptional regulator [bacterium]|nr:MAG: sigma 54-interacting transcriptional regulator [bacterium]